MRAYYGSRISENMTVTPEGFLICLGVPIARTGVQEYLPNEIGVAGEALIEVRRMPEDVFSAPTLASFEGKPVTIDHPPGAVEPNNASAYVKGHAQNIRRGTGTEEDLVLADLFITDAELIRLIRHAGVREISCGYECEYAHGPDGEIYQRSIRGNHIAVVTSGRAGARVAIKDAKTKKHQGGRNDMNRKLKNTLFSRMFAGWAKDAEPEDVAAALDEWVEQALESNGEPPPTQPDAEEGEDNPPELAGLLAQLLTAVQTLSAKLDAVSAQAPEEDDPIARLERELTEPAAEEGSEAAGIIDAEEGFTGMDDEFIRTPDEEAAPISEEALEHPLPAVDRAVFLAALGAIKPVIAELPPRERRAASDAATRQLRRAMGRSARPGSNGYRMIDQARRQPALTKGMASDEAKLGRDIMAKYNPHYKAEEK